MWELLTELTKTPVPALLILVGLALVLLSYVRFGQIQITPGSEAQARIVGAVLLGVGVILFIPSIIIALRPPANAGTAMTPAPTTAILPTPVPNRPLTQIAVAAPTDIPPTQGNTLPPTPTDSPSSPTPKPSIPTLTPKPTTMPTPEAGILYQADWSSGLNGWPGTFGWKVLKGILLNDGSGADGGKWKEIWVAAPYQPGDTVDYAVEAEIEAVDVPGCGSFGLVIRGAYEAGLYNCGGPGVIVTSKDGDVIDDHRFSFPSGWHTYRYEVKGNTFQFTMDEAILYSFTDNRYLSNNSSRGSVGLWCDRMQINVRSFKVIEP
jgi:hypothetical protein